MTINEAKNNLREIRFLDNITSDDEFLYIESLEFLIKETNDPEYMMDLGGYYYEKQEFDLALKYYDMAALKDYDPAFECLGYIWYYGRTGVKDYKKAYENFEKAMKNGNIIATYKIADMYRNGYYVEKDLNKYKEIIEDLYPKVKDMDDVFAPIPEIYTRLAKIRIEENKNEEALSLLEDARRILEKRIHFNGFFGNLTIMKWLIIDLYKVKKFDNENFGLYDLFYLLNEPHTVRFTFINKKYEIESIEEEGNIVIKFNDKWYRDIDEFFKKANIDGDRLINIIYDLEDFKLVK